MILAKGMRFCNALVTTECVPGDDVQVNFAQEQARLAATIHRSRRI